VRARGKQVIRHSASSTTFLHGRDTPDYGIDPALLHRICCAEYMSKMVCFYSTHFRRIDDNGRPTLRAGLFFAFHRTEYFQSQVCSIFSEDLRCRLGAETCMLFLGTPKTAHGLRVFLLLTVPLQFEASIIARLKGFYRR